MNKKDEDELIKCILKIWKLHPYYCNINYEKSNGMYTVYMIFKYKYNELNNRTFKEYDEKYFSIIAECMKDSDDEFFVADTNRTSQYKDSIEELIR